MTYLQRRDDMFWRDRLLRLLFAYLVRFGRYQVDEFCEEDRRRRVNTRARTETAEDDFTYTTLDNKVSRLLRASEVVWK